MGILDSFFDSDKNPETIIKGWKPRGCSTEKDYENSLIKYWRKVLPKSTVTPQYAIGRTKADIVIDRKTIIELKKDLRTTAVRDRLIGQLTQYKEWKGRVFVILVGNTDPDILSVLNKFVGSTNTEDISTLLSEPKITLIMK